MKEDLTHLVFAVDRSGSMHSIKEAMDEAINGILVDQKDEPGSCTCSIYQFDNNWVDGGIDIDTVCDTVDIRDAPKFEIKPRGRTPLIDALCAIIDKIGSQLSGTPENLRPAKVVVAIITDGLENASHEFKREDLKERIHRQTNEYSWTFMFIGADQDAVQEAQSYGIHINNSITFAKTGAGVGKMSEVTSGKLAGIRALSSEAYTENAISGMHCGYTEEERQEQRDEGAVA